jgi:SAM-dependent methyltransferase
VNDRRFFARVDESPDALFYRDARLVEHIDGGAIAAVEHVYRTWIPPASRVLDLMSSWVSHLPAEVRYACVTGLGMNATELARNSRLDRRIVHDLNAEPRLPFDDASFDVALICVSVQYLTRPIEVMRELARVVRARGRAIVTFSNRCFPTKAVAIWQATDDDGHVQLVEGYLREAGWDDVRTFAHVGRGDPLYAIVAERLGDDLEMPRNVDIVSG